MNDSGVAVVSPPAQDEAVGLEAGSPVSAHNQESQGFEAEAAEPFVRRETATARRSPFTRWPLLGALGAVVLAVVLATVMKKTLKRAEAPTEPAEVTKGDLPPEFREVLDNIVKWARQARTDRRLSLREALAVSLQQQLERNGVKYTVTARFRSLTPEYDPEETADELEEELPELFKESIESEEDVRSISFGAEEAGGDGAFSTGAHDMELTTMHGGGVR
ncbi:hypothetical protein Emed_000876 [Eimeria media]